MIEVEIDKDSGFCFGVVTAIESAERELGNTDTLYCLGDIVHNSLEVERLEHMGLHTIDHEGLSRLRDRKVLLRAHGEPPSTYALAKRNNITIIDATCPVVLRLQRKIHKCYQETRANNTQLVIYEERPCGGEWLGGADGGHGDCHRENRRPRSSGLYPCDQSVFPNHEVLGWIQGGSGGDQAADGGRGGV